MNITLDNNTLEFLKSFIGLFFVPFTLFVIAFLLKWLTKDI
jgi:hypothetical protein